MGFRDVFITLSTFKRQQLIRDYVVIGAVAAMAYHEPMYPGHLDLVILVDSDEEYLEVFEGFSNLAEGADHMQGSAGAGAGGAGREPAGQGGLSRIPDGSSPGRVPGYRPAQNR